MFKKIISFSALVFIFSGCIPKRDLSSLQIPNIKNKEEASTVIIMRNFNYFGGGIHYWPTIDGKDLAGLKSYEYIKLLTTATKHKLGVRYYGGWKILGWNHSTINIKLAKKKKYFYLISPTLIGTVEIENITEKEAKIRIIKSKEVPLGSVSESFL